MKHNKLKIALAACMLGLLTAVPLFFIFAWSSFDVSDVDRGSIMFRLAAPDHLAAVETIGECRSPKYQWKGRDGASVPFSSVTYGSAASTSDITSAYTEAFKKQNCTAYQLLSTMQKIHIHSMRCKNKNFLEVKIFILEEGHCKDITVDFLENG